MCYDHSSHVVRAGVVRAFIHTSHSGITINMSHVVQMKAGPLAQ